MGLSFALLCNSLDILFGVLSNVIIGKEIFARVLGLPEKCNLGFHAIVGLLSCYLSKFNSVLLLFSEKEIS